MTSNQRGFTLLELVIALAIVGALLAVAFGGLRVGLAAWGQGEDRAEAHQHIRGVALSLARALGGAYPYRGSRTDAPESVLLFSGEPHRIEFVTQTAPFGFSIPIAFTAVAIELGEGESAGLVVKQRALPNFNPFSDATTVLTDPAVTAVDLAYMDQGGAWQERWESGGDRAMPRAVRLTLGTRINGRPEPLPAITVAFRVGAE
jgi:prepilin-type N-terminal cleavage/methylation domain-containing protein